MARKGKSNHRWIVGAKFFVLLNSWGQVVRWNCCAANLHDTVFHCAIEDFDEQMIVLADTGFHAKESGRPGQSQTLPSRHLERTDVDGC